MVLGTHGAKYKLSIDFWEIWLEEYNKNSSFEKSFFPILSRTLLEKRVVLATRLPLNNSFSSNHETKRRQSKTKGKKKESERRVVEAEIKDKSQPGIGITRGQESCKFRAEDCNEPDPRGSMDR